MKLSIQVPVVSNFNHYFPFSVCLSWKFYLYNILAKLNVYNIQIWSFEENYQPLSS